MPKEEIKEETIEKFTRAFPKLYFFIRPNHRQKHPRKRASKRHTKNEITINQIHYNVLWLIDVLIEKEGVKGCCLESSLKNVFLWRQPNDESQFNGIIAVLRTAGLIETKKDDLADGRMNLFGLTAEGTKMVEGLREHRKETATDIFDLLKLTDNESAESFVDTFIDTAERAWQILEAKAKEKAEKQKTESS